jgi:hypothetical protein
MADLLAGHVSRATILPRRAAPDDLCGLSLAGLLVHAQVHVHVPMRRQAYLRLRPDPERRVGRSRLVSANPASRYTRPLTEGLARVRPQFVIGEEFAALGVAAVAIFGSWAARYEGITGPAE